MSDNIIAEAIAPIRNGQLVWVGSGEGPADTICTPATMSDTGPFPNGVATRNPANRDGWAEGDLVPVRQSGGILAEIDGESCWVEFDSQGRAVVQSDCQHGVLTRSEAG